MAPGAPPFLLVHGTGDLYVPSGQAVALKAAMEAQGNVVELLLIDGGGHSANPNAEVGGSVFGDLVIDERMRVITLAGQPLDLARKEFDLLLALAQRPGEVVTKRELLSEVWQQAYGGSDRTVDVHLSWLRRKLGESAAEPRYLHSVRGVGVRLVDPDQATHRDS